jgi:hypothetical protein
MSTKLVSPTPPGTRTAPQLYRLHAGLQSRSRRSALLKLLWPSARRRGKERARARERERVRRLLPLPPRMSKRPRTFQRMRSVSNSLGFRV